VLFIVCAICVGEMFFWLSCFMVDVSHGGLCLFDDVKVSIYDLCDGDSWFGGQLSSQSSYVGVVFFYHGLNQSFAVRSWHSWMF